MSRVARGPEIRTARRVTKKSLTLDYWGVWGERNPSRSLANGAQIATGTPLGSLVIRWFRVQAPVGHEETPLQARSPRIPWGAGKPYRFANAEVL